MKQQAILDFTADGKAVVQIPDVGKMAFINTFGLSKIGEVEKDIEEADTAERKQFMQNYISEYRSIFGNDVERSKETTELMEKFEDALVDKFPIFTTKELDCYDYADEQYDDAWDIVSDDDSQELEDALENSYIREISVNVYKMKHSSAWYLMGYVNADIESTTKQLELTKGKLLFFNQFKVVARILEKDLPTFDDQVKEIMESCKMTREQTKYCFGLPTNELAKFNVNETEKEILSIEKRLSLLKRLL